MRSDLFAPNHAEAQTQTGLALQNSKMLRSR